MAGRYAGVVRIRYVGDKNLAARYVPEARKYLGALGDNLALGRIPSGLLSRTNRDGANFRVMYVDGQPIVEIDVSRVKSGTTTKTTFLNGIVVRPRQPGTTGSPSDGQNAYGLYSHNIVVGKAGESAADPTEWQTYFYDDTYKTLGFEESKNYTVNGVLAPVFFEGLVAAGPNDWRDSGEKIVITWMGRPTRAIPRAAQVFDNFIYHNGVKIFDAGILPSSSRGIVCACVRKYGGQWYLVVALNAATSSMNLKVYRCLLHADDVTEVPSAPGAPALQWVSKIVPPIDDVLWPRLKEVVVGECELLFEYTPDISADTNTGTIQPGMFTFNQSATEMRGIIPCLNFGAYGSGGSSDSKWEFKEVVVDVSVLEAGSISATTTHLGYGGETVTRTTSRTACSPNVANYFNFTLTSSPPTPPVFAGSYPRTYEKQWHFTNFQDSANPSFDQILNYRYATSETTQVPLQGAVPILVEYEDDVPVYLYWELGAATSSGVWTTEFSNVQDGVYDAADVYGGTDIYSHFQATGNRSNIITTSHTYEATRTGTRSRFYAVDKLGATWFDIQESVSYSGTANAEATATDFRETYSDAVSAWSRHYGALDGRQEHSASGYLEHTHFWFIDLRSKSISVTKLNDTVTGERLTTTTASNDETHASSDSAYWTAPVSATATTVNAPHLNTSLFTYTTQLWFYGVKIREFSSTHSAVNSDSSGSSTSSVTMTSPFVWPIGATASMTGLLAPSSALIMLTEPIHPTVGAMAGEDYVEAMAIFASLTSGWGVGGPTPFDQTTSSPMTPDTTIEIDGQDAEYYKCFGENFTSPFAGGLVGWQYIGQTASGGFSGLAVDGETQAGTFNNTWIGTRDGFGRFVAYRRQFAYSMFDLDDRVDVRVRAWLGQAGVVTLDQQNNPAENPFFESSLVDLDAITGDRDAGMFSVMWPTSICVYQQDTVGNV